MHNHTLSCPTRSDLSPCAVASPVGAMAFPILRQPPPGLRAGGGLRCPRGMWEPPFEEAAWTCVGRAFSVATWVCNQFSPLYPPLIPPSFTPHFFRLPLPCFAMRCRGCCGIPAPKPHLIRICLLSIIAPHISLPFPPFLISFLRSCCPRSLTSTGTGHHHQPPRQVLLAWIAASKCAHSGHYYLEPGSLPCELFPLFFSCQLPTSMYTSCR